MDCPKCESTMISSEVELLESDGHIIIHNVCGLCGQEWVE